jgi:hypothetical protein
MSFDSSTSASPPEPPIPPLKHGERLTREDFERRYEAMRHLNKAELIEGIVYLPAPASVHRATQPRLRLCTWLGSYEAATPGVEGGYNSTVRLDPTNEPQPDMLLLIDPGRGGQAQLSEDDFVESAPELMADAVDNCATDQLNIKLHACRRNRVREYIVWRTQDQQLDWLILRSGDFQPQAADSEGILRSEVFPGLWLDRTALLRGDMLRVMAVVQQGVASPEHAAFLQRLRAPRNGR